MSAVLLVCVFYVALPASLVWGWVRWGKRTRSRNVSGTLSFIGFTLANFSALLAISSMVYARVIGGFRYYDSSLLKIYAFGSLLSLGGLIFAVGGLWRPNPLRWLAPVCSVGMLLFWFAMGAGE
jgi:hypothetical protein